MLREQAADARLAQPHHAVERAVDARDVRRDERVLDHEPARARVHAALGAEAPAIAEMRRRVLRKSVEAHVIRVAARSAAPIDAVAVERLVTAALASLFN